jgi:hypothetical protein
MGRNCAKTVKWTPLSRPKIGRPYLLPPGPSVGPEDRISRMVFRPDGPSPGLRASGRKTIRRHAAYTWAGVRYSRDWCNRSVL